MICHMPISPPRAENDPTRQSDHLQRNPIGIEFFMRKTARWFVDAMRRIGFADETEAVLLAWIHVFRFVISHLFSFGLIYGDREQSRHHYKGNASSFVPIKQYYKEHNHAQGLRTETTINNTRDFGLGKGLINLPALREVGFTANRRLLNVQRISHDCFLGEAAFNELQQPLKADSQRIPSLRLGAHRAQALLATLLTFRLQPRGFRNGDLRQQIAPLLGLSPDEMSPGRMTYDLRRLRYRGLIERVQKSNRYLVTEAGLRTALFYTIVYGRIIRPGLSDNLIPPLQRWGNLGAAFGRVEAEMNRLAQQVGVAVVKT